MSVKAGELIEVTRSFSFKLNVGNYETRDFFCSQKAECLKDKAEETSRALHAFCMKQVMLDVAAYKNRIKND